MAVNLAAPDLASLPVAGVALGIAEAGIRKADRKDLLRHRARRRRPRRRRVHAEPLLRRAGDRCREHLAQSGGARSARWSSTPATPTPAPASDGLAAARATCAGAGAAARLRAEQVLPFSTGVIMEPLPVERIVAGLPRCVANLERGRTGPSAAEAIMTTDTVPKAASGRVHGRRTRDHGDRHRQGRRHDPAQHGDDAGLRRDRCARERRRCCSRRVRYAADRSFNCITVDGDTSTNDRFVLIATGPRGHAPKSPMRDSAEYAAFRDAVTEVAERARAGDRARRRGRDQVHHHAGRRRAQRDRVPQGRATRSRIRRW